MKKALPFPSFNTYKGWISITDFHGGAMPICQPSGYKNTANGLFAVLAFRLRSMLNTTKVARIIETATKIAAKLADYLNFVLL